VGSLRFNTGRWSGFYIGFNVIINGPAAFHRDKWNLLTTSGVA